MPPLEPVPGVIKVIHSWTMSSKNAVNIQYYSFSGTIPAPLSFVTACATAVAAEVVTQNLMWDAFTTYMGCEVIDLSNDTGYSYIQVEDEVGTRSGLPLPANAAVLATFPIGRRYRGGHPRVYWPWGTGEDVDTKQLWESGSVGAFQTATTSILGVLPGLSSDGATCDTQVNVSYVNAGARRDVPIVDEILSSIVQIEIASQRRRDGRH